MANILWGKVYYKDKYAGRLCEEPGGRIAFSYDHTYIQEKQPAIAYTLPLRHEPYVSEQGLHPFFDNLVAEGWSRNAQAKALSIDPKNRFSLLLGFGYDLAGAVSVIDPEPRTHHILDHTDDATLAALLGRASLSGIQRKLLVVKEGKKFRFGVSDEAVVATTKTLGKHLPQACSAIEATSIGTLALRKQLIEKMEKRWDGSFALTGQRLLKKQSKDAKHND